MYKIIQNDRVIDVVQTPFFVKFLPSGHISFTDKASAEGIVGSDEFTAYSFKARPNFLQVSIEAISSEEYSRLRDLLYSGKEISADETALAEAKRRMVSKLSSICKNAIILGFSITLSDGSLHSFKLTAEDQLNLMIIDNQIRSGATSFIYHETNGPCKVFSLEDMEKVVAAFKKHTLYHTTYFNAAKQYINSLTSIEKVNLFTYGTDVSEIITDKILRKILKDGGSVE
jgi:hypothetical protein